MSLFAQDLARAGIQRDHPEWEEACVARELLRLAFLPDPLPAQNYSSMAYMLTGSFASADYGVPRSTQDIDLIIEATADQLRTFVQSLPGTEYYAELDAALESYRRESLFNVIDLTTGWKED
jgi:hypothetical protein